MEEKAIKADVAVAIRGVSVNMLIFESFVKATDSDLGIYVFVDAEKGHTVYMSPNGTITVLEEGKNSKGKDRVAGFLANSSCSDCNGC